MPVTIHVNGRANSLVHKGSNCIAKNTVPDVCKTPSPGGPVPIPYPVIVSMSSDLADGSTTVKADGGNMAAIKGCEFSRCSGDEAGTVGGVKSSTFGKEAKFILYSFDVKIDGQNACRLGDKMTMNHENTVCLGGPMQQGVAVTKCPPHEWVVTSQKTPDKAKSDNQAEAARLRAKGGKRDIRQAETLEFANKAIDTNMASMKIQAVEVKIKCSDCGEEGEIDILGDEQVAESQSESARNLDTDKRKSKQAKRLNDVQNTMNGLQGTNHKPKAKIDSTQIGDQKLAEKTCARRNMATEFI